MTGAARRAFQAEMTLKYCHGSARFAETVLGWSRNAVEVGLAEHCTGICCLGAHSAWSGRKRWEEKYPEAAQASARVGRSARAARPDVSHDTRVYAADGQGGGGSAAGTRDLSGAAALPKHHGGGVKPHGLSPAQSHQSQATEKDSGDRCHFCQSQKKTRQARALQE